VLRRLVSDLRQNISESVRNYPALVILAGLLAGLLPFTLEFSGSLIMALSFAAVSIIIFRRSDAVRFILSAAAGIISFFLSSLVPIDDCSRTLPPGDCGAVVECTVSDSSCVGANVEWMKNPRYIYADLKKFKYTESDKWHDASGTLYVRLPEDFRNVSYSDTLLLRGYFSDIETPVISAGFNMQRFLETRGIRKTFSAFEGEIARRGKGIKSIVSSLRDFLLEKVCSNVKSDEHKRILAALVFGCKQGIGKENKEEFIKSGVIHAFTVSGLHIGILALILYWILRFVPFRARYLLLPFLIFIYIFTTGMQPPAVRAFLVISLWCFFRAFFYYTPVLNSTFLAAALILIVSPLYILDAGFQYSFVITIFLIMAGPSIIMWQRCATEKLSWIPSENVSNKDYFFYRLLKYTIGAVLFCSVAWLASSGITLYNQGLYIPGSILTNLFMGPFVFLIFIVSIIKLMLEPLSIFSEILGSMLDFTVGVLIGICSSAARLSADGSLPSPSFWMLGAFYLFLAVLVTARKAIAMTFAAGAVFLMVFLWHAGAVFSKPSILVTHGDGAGVSVLIAEPELGRGIVFNTPSWGLSMELCNYLKIKGISRINRIILQEGRSEFSHGLGPFMKSLEIGAVVLPSNYKRSRSVAKNIREVSKSGTEICAISPENGSWIFKTAGLRTECSENLLKFEYTTSELNLSGEIKNDGLGRSELIINNKKGQRRFSFVNGSARCFMEIELN